MRGWSWMCATQMELVRSFAGSCAVGRATQRLELAREGAWHLEDLRSLFKDPKVLRSEGLKGGIAVAAGRSLGCASSFLLAGVLEEDNQRSVCCVTPGDLYKKWNMEIGLDI
ncbi:hypothetical protein Taro_036012 [Colocasia esculenta]|uniref:Uncharacterized protein n=1 Tax=Colocasia esculenta TaxID=4460 RepID=A0A843WC62_COLES|nr:hypothetical protein [Colocasia esculenta]